MARKSLWREKAEKLVGIYLDWRISTDSDAGWQGGSLIGRLVDFRGEIPRSSGYIPSDGMICAIRSLCAAHHDLPLARRILDAMPKSLLLAVMHDQWYRRKTRRIEGKEVYHTEASLADLLGVKPKTFVDNVSAGYRWIAEQGGFLQEAA